MANKLIKYKHFLLAHIILSGIVFIMMILCYKLWGGVKLATSFSTFYLVYSVIMFLFFKNNIGNDYTQDTITTHKIMATTVGVLFIVANIAICTLINNYCINNSVAMWSMIVVSLLCALFILRICFVFLKH